MRSLGPGAPPPAPIPVPACPPPPSVPTSCQIPFRNTSPACLPSSARPGPDWPPPRDTSQGSGGPAPASGPWRGPRVAAPGHPTHSACLPPPRAASPPQGLVRRRPGLTLCAGCTRSAASRPGSPHGFLEGGSRMRVPSYPSGHTCLAGAPLPTVPHLSPGAAPLGRHLPEPLSQSPGLPLMG